MELKAFKIRPTALLFFAALAFTACSKDNDKPIGGGEAPTTNNFNSNLKEANRNTHLLEFPRVKGGKSIIITHRLNNERDEINYSLEWDGEKSRIVGLVMKSIKVTLSRIQIDGTTHLTNILLTHSYLQP